MRVTTIKVSAGRTFNHPYEQYSNLRPEIQLVAELNESDDAEKCVKDLQAQAESIVEDHKQNMLRSLHQIRQMDLRAREMAKLESLIKTSQVELDRYRANPIEGKPPLDFFGPKPESDDLEYCKECGMTECDCKPF